MASCLNSRGEVPCKCCGDRTFNWVAMLYGGLALIAFIIGALSTVSLNWTTFTFDAGSFLDDNGEQNFFFGLWARFRGGDDDDDLSRITGNDDALVHWSTFRLNRATTLITLVLAFFVAIYYMVSACCGRCKPMEIVVGSIFILLFLLSLSGSSQWVDKFDDKYFFDDLSEFVEDKVICGQGCALQFFNAFFCLFVGVGMLLFATRNCFCFPDDPANTLARTEEFMMP